MKRMKRGFLNVIGVMLLIACVLATSACFNDKPSKKTTAPTTTAPTTTVPSTPVPSTPAPSTPAPTTTVPVTTAPDAVGPEHEHAYSSAVTPPSCTERGYTTYTCGCGHSYVGNYTSPGNHSYENKITRRPTTLIQGARTYTCTDCGHSYVEPINTISFELPSISSEIARGLRDGSYRLVAEENTQFILVQELGDYSEPVGVKEVLVARFAEAVLEVEGDDLQGDIVLELGVAEIVMDGTSAASDSFADSFDSVMTLNIYLDGDALSFEIVIDGMGNEGSYDLNEVFYNGIAEMYGISYEELVEILYYCDEMGSYASFTNKIMEILADSDVSAALPDLSALAAILGEGIVSTVENGQYTTYKISIANLHQMLDEYKGKTLAQIIDGQFGQGATDVIAAYLTNLPDMTVREIANAAIELSQNYEIDLNDVYMWINSIAFYMYEIEIDIESEIESRYQATLAEILAEAICAQNPNADVSEVAGGLKNALASLVAMAESYTLDNFYNLFCYGDPEYTLGNGEQSTAFTDALGMLIDLFSELGEIEVTFDAEDTIVSVSASVNEVDIEQDGGIVSSEIASVDYINRGNGAYDLSVVIGVTEIIVAGSQDGSCTLTVQSGGQVLLEGAFSTETFVNGDESGRILEMTVGENSIICTIVSAGNTLSVSSSYNGENVLALTLCKDQYGTVTDFEFSLNVPMYQVSGENGETAVFINFMTLSYSDNGNGEYVFSSGWEYGESTVTVTQTADGTSVVFYAESFGEVGLDGTVDVKTSDDSLEISFDIDRILLSMGNYESPEDEQYIPFRIFVGMLGGVTFTYEQ